MHPIFFSRWNFQSVEKSNTFHKKEGIPITESWKYVPYGSVRKLLDLEFYYILHSEKMCIHTIWYQVPYLLVPVLLPNYHIHMAIAEEMGN